MSIQGPGNTPKPNSPNNSKPEPKENQSKGIWSWGKSISKSIYDWVDYSTPPLKQENGKQLPDYQISQATTDCFSGQLPTSMQALAKKLPSLSQSREVSEGDPKLSEEWNFIARKLTRPAELSPKSTRNESKGYLTDKDRNRHFSLNAVLPDQSFIDTGDVNQILDRCLEQYPTKDLPLVKCQMTELCTQTASNSLHSLLHAHLQDLLGEDVIPIFPKSAKVTTTFICKNNYVEAHILVHADSFQLMDVLTSDRAEIHCKTSMKAKVEIPLNSPGSGSLKHLSLGLGDVTRVVAQG
ncbi:hypothetical protein [Endozoicomonas arenosclerae]|uniref:hypothetical protein n=1 Tax=Endozoicomonas arenosclerae TaxID=1633495 RepID=UPI000783E3B2|nr:hypothetical protein [Endozoicomonas arenosclerae]